MQHLQIIKDYLEENQLDINNLIYDKCVKYELKVDDDISLNQQQTNKSSTKAENAAKRMRLELIEKHCSTSVLGDSPLECIRRELHEYTSVIGVDDEPLDWWKKNQRFPYLSKLAKVMLSFMATSAIVERFFSKAGILMTKRKANLDPVNMTKILFIHENFQLIKYYYKL